MIDRVMFRTHVRGVAHTGPVLVNAQQRGVRNKGRWFHGIVRRINWVADGMLWWSNVLSLSVRKRAYSVFSPKLGFVIHQNIRGDAEWDSPMIEKDASHMCK